MNANVQATNNPTITVDPNFQPLQSLFIYTLYAPLWEASVKDRSVEDKVKADNNIQSGVKAGSYRKHLLPECPELDALNALQRSIRQEFYQRTAPWGETRASRVGKVENHMDMMAWIGDKDVQLEDAKNALAAVYDERVQQSIFKLNGLATADEYPTVDEVLGRYQLQLYAQTLGNPQDIRVVSGIPAHEKARLEIEAREAERRAIADVLRDTFARLYQPVAHLAETLKAYDADPDNQKGKKLFGSLIGNVANMVEVARRLNICDDATLAQFVDEAEKLVEGVTIKDVKESDGLRKTLATEADRIAAQLKAWT